MKDETNKARVDSSPMVILTEDRLRVLIREEVAKAMGSNGKAVRSPENGPRDYLKVGEAAELSRLAPSTIRLYVSKGKLKSQKVGRRVLIKRIELERFLDAHTTGTCEN